MASGALLKIIAVGNLMLTDLKDFTLEKDGTNTPVTTSGTWHNMMVVQGLDPHTILLSVKRMREDDNIRTYFNFDNIAGMSDCIKLPNGVYVPFSSENFELRGRPSTSECNHIGHKQSHRTPIHIHAALCHTGRKRVTTSRITIDGEAVTRLLNTELCKGCALGGTRCEHREGVSTRRNGT